MTVGQAQGEFLLYQAEDAQTRIQVRFADEGLWLTQQQLAELFQSSSQNITQHIKAIYSEGELREEATCKPYLHVLQEGARQVSRSIKHYNLDMIMAVGYRVRSRRGMPFRRWATEQLKSYLIKGFVLDDERFKSGRDDAYFEELLARNGIVNAYIEVAELQTQVRREMAMHDWATRLDDFLRMTERDVLPHAGRISAEVAQIKAEAAYLAYEQQQKILPSRVEQDFEEAIAQPVKQIEKSRKPARLPKQVKGKAV